MLIHARAGIRVNTFVAKMLRMRLATVVAQQAGSVGLKHRSSWQKMALVTDKNWIRHGAAVFGPLAPGELRIFDPDEKDQAKNWITGPSPN